MPDAASPDILCIGSVLWDVIGRSGAVMRLGSDVPGRITRIPGGVAMNIAMALHRFGLSPAILTAVGRDAEGDELIRAATHLGVITDHVYRSDDLPTDRYMAVEGANGLIAAIADAHSLETAGAKILEPLENGSLGSPDKPYGGVVALDGNLTERLLAEVPSRAAFAGADLRLAPASPGKALRLMPLLRCKNATVYLNLEEANLLLHAQHDTAEAAARGLVEAGARRVLVTNGGRTAAEAGAEGLFTATPPDVLVTRVTGAGDTFMAAHIAAELGGLGAQDALSKALREAARYVSGDVEP